MNKILNIKDSIITEFSKRVSDKELNEFVKSRLLSMYSFDTEFTTVNEVFDGLFIITVYARKINRLLNSLQSAKSTEPTKQVIGNNARNINKTTEQKTNDKNVNSVNALRYPTGYTGTVDEAYREATTLEDGTFTNNIDSKDAEEQIDTSTSKEYDNLEMLKINLELKDDAMLLASNMLFEFVHTSIIGVI